MSFDPSIGTEPEWPRRAAGPRKIIALDHPLTGLIYTKASSFDSGKGYNRSFTITSQNPPRGPKQKRLHSRGTSEISWGIRSDLTAENCNLLNLLKAEARGEGFKTVHFLQGVEGVKYTTAERFEIPWSSISFSASQKSIVTVSLNGNSCLLGTSSPTLIHSGLESPIPSWATGNTNLIGWEISHNVSQTPNYANSQDLLPVYYRPGLSEWRINLTSRRAYTAHTLIRFQTGNFTLIQAVVSSENISSSSAGGVTYSVNVENIANSYTGSIGATVVIPIWPQTLWDQ